PPSCQLTGGKCSTASDCCFKSCVGGMCYLSGSIGDDACMSPLQCVTGLCTDGHCNRDSPVCTSGPGNCENCLALDCCDAMAACTTPPCTAALGCFRRCTRKNASREACASSCGLDATPEGKALSDCGYHRCSGSCG